jgi:TRAP transporter TAXI family solute receptor
LYGAPAQVVVLKKSGILSARDLAGKRVAVGNAGSGAALSAERFFRQLGIWDGVNRQFLGYSAASSAFLDRKIDAFWVLVGYPNSSILQTAAQDDVDLVNLADEAEETGFFEAYPFYSPVTIPAKTYTGVDSAIRTFQDSAIWAVRSGLDSETVYRILKTVFSPEGLNHLRLATQTAESMSVQDGLQGIRTPLAQGAAKFWEENGLPIPPSLRPAE